MRNSFAYYIGLDFVPPIAKERPGFSGWPIISADDSMAFGCFPLNEPGCGHPDLYYFLVDARIQEHWARTKPGAWPCWVGIDPGPYGPYGPFAQF